MSASLDAIKAKVRALLAKTVVNGCTEAEAIAAAAKAMELMRAHQITAAELDMGRTGSSVGRSRRQLIDTLWPLVGQVCRCQSLLVQREGGPLRVEFIGRQPWPDVADWLRGTLQAAHGRALGAYRQTPEYQRRRNTRTRAAARRMFTAGFIEVVAVKLRRLVGDWAELKRELDLVKTACAATFENARTMANLGEGRAPRNSEGDRAAGAAAGQRTAVNWAMTGGSRKLIGSDRA